MQGAPHGETSKGEAIEPRGEHRAAESSSPRSRFRGEGRKSSRRLSPLLIIVVAVSATTFYAAFSEGNAFRESTDGKLALSHRREETEAVVVSVMAFLFA
jgi:hypothetical protein